MNEQELRDGLREVMAVSSQPPSMNPTEALDAAKRAHKRRRATWAGAGAGAAVVALAAGTVFALTPSNDTLPIDVAATANTTDGTPMTTNGTAITKSGTETSWPTGQVDRTARNGPRSDTANGVLATLKAALPDTLTVDETTTRPGGGGKITLSQANFNNYYGQGNKQEAWDYSAIAAVASKTNPQGGTGRVLVTVFTPGNPAYADTDVCVLTGKFWGVRGTCEPRTVQGKTVGVIVKPQDSRISTVVGYRYDDGTVVFVAQSTAPNNEGDSSGPPAGSMSTLPLTVEQLAPMALNPAFKVT
nr:hypothetical protein [Kibdelosporangium sp. MJ126-NF4]CEL13805.1 hypothetical protein [Kibdelosporangium sp. MJ126-NF4]CTQ88173.1 hypothetical protein [Kibdelosporangium sp. MJ126-NF4]